MAKQADRSPSQRPRQAASADGADHLRWPLWLRALLSIAIVWHCFVVAICPFYFVTESRLVRSSGLAEAIVRENSLVRGYADILYLNSGYGFFGPDPPMTNATVSFVVLGQNGAELAREAFPDLRDQWPRLWYHRFMMLSDQSAIPFAGFSEDEAHRVSLESFGRHLLATYDGARVDLTHRAKFLLTPLDLLDGEDPNDPKFLLSPTDVTVTADQLDTPLIPASPSSFPEEIPARRSP